MAAWDPAPVVVSRKVSPHSKKAYVQAFLFFSSFGREKGSRKRTHNQHAAGKQREGGVREREPSGVRVGVSVKGGRGGAKNRQPRRTV